jgi:glycosyltransferase A (GT-A) superfamily protein (DUF2064 family)
MTALVVLAKAPRPGHSKTRLAPAFGFEGAACLAAAALQDTLEAVAATPADRRVLALDGRLGHGALPVDVPVGFEVVPQRGGTHAERIAAALAGCREPAVLVGMDTPQVTPGLLSLALDDSLSDDDVVDNIACLGPAEDGGWWALGLSRPARFAHAALAGVPMSVPWTGRAQLGRLQALGLRVTTLPRLRDVDTPDDAGSVAAASRGTRFARLHAELSAARVARA